ncbi:MAG TPA: CheR family methyltransferase [Verrucomicrobiae bacterium]|nr:CheR family methyltransferase [Verrucomicrobiae bacterium]
MKPEEFRLLQEFVTERYGILVDPSKQRSLSSLLVPRLASLRLASFTEYYTYLKYSPQADRELALLVPMLTNNETYFYREEPQLALLSRQILPQVKKERSDGPCRALRILSAGCSTGEEAYTLALLVIESGLFLWDWDVRVTGVDVDGEALAAAREGVYAGKSFHSLPERYRGRYFLPEGERFRVRDNLRRITSFRQGNLLEIDEVVEGEKMDVIFCRNVFIYFPLPVVRMVVERFIRLLLPGGWLFLGHSESMSKVSDRFEPVHAGSGIAYRLRD